MRSNTRVITTIGIMSALSVVLVFFVHFPIFPSVSFLKYDPADVPIVICTYIFGPLYGVLMTAVVSIIQGLTVNAEDGWVGIVMHFIATGTLAVVSGVIFRRFRSIGGEIASVIGGILSMTAVMAIWNLLLTPYFMGLPLTLVLELYPYIILFNLVKAGLNTIIAYLIFKALKPALKKLSLLPQENTVS